MPPSPSSARSRTRATTCDTTTECRGARSTPTTSPATCVGACASLSFCQGRRRNRSDAAKRRTSRLTSTEPHPSTTATSKTSSGAFATTATPTRCPSTTCGWSQTTRVESARRASSKSGSTRTWPSASSATGARSATASRWSAICARLARTCSQSPAKSSPSREPQQPPRFVTALTDRVVNGNALST